MSMHVLNRLVLLIAVLFLTTRDIAAQGPSARTGEAPSSVEEALIHLEQALDHDASLSPETRAALQGLVQALQAERAANAQKADTGQGSTATGPDTGYSAPGAEKVSTQSSPQVAAEKTEKKEGSKLALSGKVYLRYSYELANPPITRFDPRTNDFNEFDIDRLYLTFDGQLWEKGRFRVTLEGGDIRENGTDQFDVSTKHAYVEFQDVFYEGFYVRLGQVDLPWVPYEEKLWGYRFQGPVFADRSGYITSTDMGITFGSPLPKDYGEWQVAVVNGEGWRRNEIGKYKDVQARLTVHPFASLDSKLRNVFVTGYGSQGAYDDVLFGDRDRDRYILQVGYREKERFTLALEHLWATDPTEKMQRRHPSLAARPGESAHAQGISLFSVLNLSVFSSAPVAKKLELIGRWDRLDPDDEIKNNDLNRYIAGISYRLNKYVQFLLDYERVDYDKGARGAVPATLWPLPALPIIPTWKDDEERIMLQTEIQF